jgi:glycerol uptake facilitator-like aquaporin
MTRDTDNGKKEYGMTCRAQEMKQEWQWTPYLAEGIGTFGLVFAGCGAIMIDALSKGQVTHVGVGLVFGLIITVIIYSLGHVSGAHFNPAVTLGFVLARHFPLRRLAGYWLAQLLGAVLAASFLRLLLGDVARLGSTLPTGCATR